MMLENLRKKLDKGKIKKALEAALSCCFEE